MPINVPSTPTSPPFLTAQPVVEFWDVSDGPQWKTFPLGRMYLDRFSPRLFNQGISDALLRYECGEISFESGQFSDISPLSIDRVWIRVTFETDDTIIVDNQLQPAPKTVTWAGIITRTEEINRASDDGLRLITQRFTAQGFEFLLSRRQIVTSEINPADQIRYGLTFNTNSDAVLGRRTVKGNRDKLFQTVFSINDESAEVWDGAAIADYLILTQFPIGAWTVFKDNLELLEWIEPVLVCHGRTVFDVFRSLASPRRGLGSHIFYTSGGSEFDFGSFTYKVDSMFPVATQLPSGVTIAANENIVNLVTSTHRDAFTTVTIDSSRRYEKVVATGAPIGSIASLSNEDNNLLIIWTVADRDAYKTGNPNVSMSADRSRRHDQHDRYRRQKFPHVFTQFVTADNWNGFVRGGELGTVRFAFEHLLGDIYPKEMRFATYLPLKVGYDYQSSEEQVTLSAPDIDQFRRPFVVFQLDQELPDSAELAWEYGHELASGEDEITGENAFGFSCYVRPLDRRLGISVKPSSVPHVISGSGADEQIDDDTSNYEQAQVSYTKMILTGYMQAHELVRGEFPDGLVAVEEDIHFLRLGDTAFYDVLKEDTVVDVLGGELIRSRFEVTLRDDRVYLQDVARIAFRWYGFDRVASQIRYNQITAGAIQGYLVGTLDDIPANAMVSSVTWNFVNQTTEVFTHFAEPDFAELASR